MRRLAFYLLLTSAVYASSDSTYKALRDATIQESFVAENVALHRDGATLTLKSGTIGLTAKQMGRYTVAVFSGDGEFVFTPALEVESIYLKSVSGKPSVSEHFDRALFCFTDDTAKEIRGNSDRGADSRLDDILREFRKRLRHRNESPRTMIEALLNSDTMDNVEADILTDLYNPAQAGFFSAYLHGKSHADLRFHLKPRGAMLELPSPEEVALLNVDPLGETEGIWYLSHTKAELDKGTASSEENRRVVEATAYTIDTAIASNDRFTASTELSFKAIRADRVIKLALKPTLRVSSVKLGGKDVDFIQEDKKEDSSFYVVLPENLKPGATGTLRIEYAGDKIVHKEGGGNFSVGARESWYPNVNTFRDRTPYDLTFRVPKRYTLVSVGKLEKIWTEKDVAATHWVSGAPVAVAGFNYGDFKKKQITDDTLKFDVEGYAVSTPPDYLAHAGNGNIAPARLLDSAMVEAQNSLRIYNRWFGASEFSRVAITQQPEFSFGQSWPTLVYLPMAVFLDSTERHELFGFQNNLTRFVNEVTAHEVAHQWWGHMVGWESFHDQWLSEGFAEFSASLYVSTVKKEPDVQKFWDESRKRILDKNKFGLRANDAGPIWLGLRLDSSRNEDAYDALVYNKGAYVLHMLRSMMWSSKTGDQPFMDMMKDFVQQHLNKNATTESFKAVAEKHMTPGMDIQGNHRLDWFFREWVFGTQIPRYKFDYTLADLPDGKCQLKASLTQSEVDANFAMLIPLYAEFDGGRMARMGSMRMIGNSTADQIQVVLPSRPKRVLVNANHDVLTY
jgi:hypothetical protein